MVLEIINQMSKNQKSSLIVWNTVYMLCTINSDTYHIKANNGLTLFAVDKSEIENYVSVYGLRTHEIFNDKPVSFNDKFYVCQVCYIM